MRQMMQRAMSTRPCSVILVECHLIQQRGFKMHWMKWRAISARPSLLDDGNRAVANARADMVVDRESAAEVLVGRCRLTV
jgi:hypothetical protein